MSTFNAAAGISFIVKIRNEEATLLQSIRSLYPLTINYEIILILHLCTDKSLLYAQTLAKENPRIKIHTYDIEVSRAGYETLATDADSPHSLMTYYNWAVSLGQLPWTFKWDADFCASASLIKYLCSTLDFVKLTTTRTTSNFQKKQIGITAKNSTSNNREYYLVNTIKDCVLPPYKKHIFWEVHAADEAINYDKITLPADIYIDHVSELTELKSYWQNEPWFLTEDSDEARKVMMRMNQLKADFGPEIKGLARASNPECNTKFKEILLAKPTYVNFFINLSKKIESNQLPQFFGQLFLYTEHERVKTFAILPSFAIKLKPLYKHFGGITRWQR
jgi:glycosyltransferase involved in cell wall biosynthesis